MPHLGNPDRLHRARLAVGNPFVELFRGRVRNALLKVDVFGSLVEAQVVIEAGGSVQHPPALRCLKRSHSHRVLCLLDHQMPTRASITWRINLFGPLTPNAAMKESRLARLFLILDSLIQIDEY